MIKWTAKVLVFVSVGLPILGLASDPASELLAAGRVDEAISNLSGKIDSSPNDALSHNLLCRAYFSMNAWDRAISACERAVALDPNNSEYHLWLGRSYGEKADASGFLTAAGLAKKVRNEFERAVSLDPGNAVAPTE